MVDDRVTIWEACEYLETEEDIAAYLKAVEEEGDTLLIQVALDDIAKAREKNCIPQDAKDDSE